MKIYRDIIRNLRIDNDLTQAQIAAELNTTYQQYQKYESGKNEMPIRVLVRLADYYGVSTDYLLGRTKCRDGVDAQNTKITEDISAGEAISDILNLGLPTRAAVVEYIKLQELKERNYPSMSR
jgi:transcriptional regulator with XRE-family HTH domain